MFHRYNTSYKKKFLKNFRSRVYVYVLRTLIALRFHRLQRHHKVAVLVASIGIFFVGIVTIVLSFSSDSVLAQIRFKIAIRLIPQCQNGIDDDGDTLIDYPLDPGCENTLDTSEGAPFVPPTVVCFAPVSQGITSQSMTWIAIPSNGNGTYTYSWSGTD